MTAGNDLGAAVLRREVVDGDDRREAVRRPRARHRIEAVVVVDGLWRFAWMDADGLARRQQVARPQEAVEDREHARVLDDVLEHAAAPDQRVDALGTEAFKGVATVMALEVGRQPFAHAPERVGGEELAEQRVALGVELVEMGLHVHASDSGGGGARILADPMARPCSCRSALRCATAREGERHVRSCRLHRDPGPLGSDAARRRCHHVRRGEPDLGRAGRARATGRRGPARRGPRARRSHRGARPQPSLVPRADVGLRPGRHGERRRQLPARAARDRLRHQRCQGALAVRRAGVRRGSREAARPPARGRAGDPHRRCRR